MKRPKENPPRRPGETAHYEDDPFELGEIDEVSLPDRRSAHARRKANPARRELYMA